MDVSSEADQQQQSKSEIFAYCTTSVTTVTPPAHIVLLFDSRNYALWGQIHVVISNAVGVLDIIIIVFGKSNNADATWSRYDRPVGIFLGGFLFLFGS